MSEEKIQAAEQAAREAAAHSLQAQIDGLLKGERAPAEKPASLRDFVASKRKLRKPSLRKKSNAPLQPPSTNDEKP